MKFIYCRGNDKDAPEIARQCGMEYGVNYRHKTFSEDVYMLDVGIGEKVQWSKYLKAVKKLKPQLAFTYDYIAPCQATCLYRQIYDLQMLDVPQIAVCPKWDGAIKHIPESCIVALSVPAPSYAGWLPPNFNILAGRHIHLLGGSIKTVSDLIPKLQGVGAILVSADGSHHARMAKQYGKWWDGNAWIQMPSKKISSHDMTLRSSINVVETINKSLAFSQASLL